MSQSYIIEVGDDQIGLVLRDTGESEFRFPRCISGLSAARRAAFC
jgi:hypothetical protein